MMKPLPLAVAVFLSFGLLLSFLVDGDKADPVVFDSSRGDVISTQKGALADRSLHSNPLANNDF